MKNSILLSLFLLCAYFVPAQEVTIEGNKFMVGDNQIWFNGINTPWHLFDDFGRTDFNKTWWTEEFAKYQNNYINLARVWIYGSGEVSPNIDATGHVSGASDLYWEHMDFLMELAKTYKVYVMPALFSFDITKNTYTKYQYWRAFLQSESNIQSYIDNVLIPMVKRYNDNPYLLGWEICNEPEWMFENDEHGPQSFDDVQKFHAMLAAAVHENCTKPVTTGSAAPKWNSPIYDSWGANEGNMFSDAALAATIGNKNAYLDFYQYHWYPWQTQWMDSPFTKTTAEYQVDDRPVIVGESEGNDVCDSYICLTVSEMYENAYLNGFDGVCGWKTPQNDGFGTFENIAVATNKFYGKHPSLVDPNNNFSRYTLTVNVGENGSVSPSSGTYISGASVTLTATPNDGYDFAGWSGDASGTSLNTTIVMDADKSVTASFALDTVVDLYTLDIEIVGKGSVSPGAGKYEEGSTITLTATPEDGYYFNSWGGDLSGGTNTVSFTIESDMSVTATFSEEPGYCDSPEAISLPFSHDGTGNYCWVVTGAMSHINSWNMGVLEINGVDYANVYSTSFPSAINGRYYIYYSGLYNWSHMELGTLKSATSANEKQDQQSISIYPNPFSETISIKIGQPESINSIEVIDNSGRLVQTISPDAISSHVTIGDGLAKGIYFIRVNDNNATQTYMINKL